MAALARPPARAVDVAGLSDLGRADGRAFGEAWPTLPESTRLAVVKLMEELAEDRLELNFGRALRVALADPSAAVRQLAITALWEEDGADLLSLLLPLVIADPSQDVRAAAATVLGRFAERAAAGELDGAIADDLRETLASLAEDETTSYLLRCRALEAVGVFSDDERVRTLIQDAYASDDQSIQASGLHAMGRGRDRRWLAILLDELKSPEPELRFEAARACGLLGDDEAVAELAEVVDERDPEIRHAAITALGQIGSRGAVRVLRNLVASARESDEELVEAALEEAMTAIDPLRDRA
jgi:HEAT repeat protein